ncbi:MAG: Clp protease ClpP [Desulfovibrio sp.]|jgi:ATP-dependent Clp protease protease subunit|nr:Clp protease ClpP [Desulfovibrio sp.]
MSLKIFSKGKSEADVYIYDVIGDHWGTGVLAKDFVKEVSNLKVDTLNVHINSPGGNAFDGIAIYNTLIQYKGNVVVFIEGLAASAASLVAMAGNEINMAENAFIMIHEVWSFVCGNANDLRKEADRLDMLSEKYAEVYTKRSNGKKSASEFFDMMKEETWMDAVEATNAGIVDNITDSIKAAAKFDLSRYNYKNIPNPVKEQFSMPLPVALRARLAAMDMAIAHMHNAAAKRQGKTHR